MLGTTMNRHGGAKPTDGARCAVRGAQDAFEHTLADLVGSEAADVAALGEHVIYRLPPRVVVTPARSSAARSATRDESKPSGVGGRTKRSRIVGNSSI